MPCHKRVCLEHSAAPTPSFSTGTTVDELAEFMKTCPLNVHEHILSDFNQLSYVEWFEKANIAGLPGVLHELRSLREGDCTMYSSCGQVLDWNDLNEYPGDALNDSSLLFALRSISFSAERAAAMAASTVAIADVY